MKGYLTCRVQNSLFQQIYIDCLPITGTQLKTGDENINNKWPLPKKREKNRTVITVQ